MSHPTPEDHTVSGEAGLPPGNGGQQGADAGEGPTALSTEHSGSIKGGGIAVQTTAARERLCKANIQVF